MKYNPGDLVAITPARPDLRPEPERWGKGRAVLFRVQGVKQNTLVVRVIATSNPKFQVGASYDVCRWKVTDVTEEGGEYFVDGRDDPIGV